MAVKKVKIFIGWSGKLSGTVAGYIQRWLKQTYPELDPFVSTDVIKGNTYFTTLLKRLRDSRSIILCLTKENQSVPWVVFEAGAVGSKAGSARAMPLLINFGKSQLIDPLKQFQATSWNRNDVLQMVKDLCSLVPLPDSDVVARFDNKWPLLRGNVKRALDNATEIPSFSPGQPPDRTIRSLASRALQRREKVIAITKSGKWTKEFWKNPGLPEYKLMTQADEDDEQLPLDLGDQVEIQCFEHIEGNGRTGIVNGFGKDAHHYQVTFTNAFGKDITRLYMALYLTRWEFISKKMIR